MTRITTSILADRASVASPGWIGYSAPETRSVPPAA